MKLLVERMYVERAITGGAFVTSTATRVVVILVCYWVRGTVEGLPELFPVGLWVWGWASEGRGR
jgi:hypothetical protein